MTTSQNKCIQCDKELHSATTFGLLGFEFCFEHGQVMKDYLIAVLKNRLD